MLRLTHILHSTIKLVESETGVLHKLYQSEQNNKEDLVTNVQR